MGCTQSVPVEMGAPVNSSKLPSVEKTVVSGKPPSIPVRSARGTIACQIIVLQKVNLRIPG